MPILLQEERDGVQLLTLNRPEALNALSTELALALLGALDAVRTRRDVRAVIISGAGDRAFSAGADLRERRGLDPDEKWAQSRRLWDVNQALWALPQAVIAAVHGWCLGGGFELALFSDLRIATSYAVFSSPEMTLGAYPGAGGAIVLPRLVGPARAKEIFFTARRIRGDDALAVWWWSRDLPALTVPDEAREAAYRLRPGQLRESATEPRSPDEADSPDDVPFYPLD